MSEQKFDAEIKATGRLDARISRDTRVYEGSDYDALQREYAQATDTGTKAERLVRAKIYVEIAKDLAANLYSLRSATGTLIESSHRLEGLTRWLVGLTVVLAALTGVLVYDVVRHLIGN